MWEKISLRQLLDEGKLVSGFEVMSYSPVLVEMVGYSGFDFVFIDTEHVPIGSDINLVHLIRAAEASKTLPIVRVKENTEPYIRPALEAGAQAIIVPHIKTKTDAEKAVKYSHYPPKGRRGTSSCVRSARYQCGDFNFEGFIQKSNEDPFIIALFEDKEFVANMEEIAQVDGIDSYCFGPLDFAMSMGINFQNEPRHPDIQSAFEAVLDTANQKKIPVLSAVIPPTAERSKELQEMGIKFQLFGTDLDIISAAFNDLAKNVVQKAQAYSI